MAVAPFESRVIATPYFASTVSIPRRTAALLGAGLILIGGFGPAAADEKQIVIGSGGTTGVYYPVAIAICRLVNSSKSEHGLSCSVESTSGSVDNLKRLREGTINFAIVQSDWQSHAFHGTGVFEGAGAHEELRSVFSLYPEAFTVVARADANISEFQELKGKRVNIGNAGSGQRATMEVVMDAFGWTRFEFSQARDFSSAHQSQALCDDEVDAIVFVAGHPSGSIKAATSQCRASLVNVSGPIIDKLVTEHDYYRHATIPAGMYRDQPANIETFGVGATLVTTSDSSQATVTGLVKTVFDKLQTFRSMHPALANLKAAEMSTEGLAAPLHAAAKAYYQN